MVDRQGSISDAQQAFERMNSTVYRLVDQEIRNAVFSGYAVLDSCKNLAEKPWTGFSSTPLEAWGFLDASALRRMRDVELYSELLHLLHSGPQNVRRNLSQFYRSFPPEDHNSGKIIGGLEDRLQRLLPSWRRFLGSQIFSSGVSVATQKISMRLLGPSIAGC